MRPLSIGKLARAAKVSIHTIRYYEKAGLLPPPARRPSGYRQYTPHDLLQLRFVRKARSLGFGLEEIAQLLALEAQPPQGKLESTALEQKLAVIDQRITELQRWRHALTLRSKSHAATGSSILLLAEHETDADTGAPAAPQSLERFS
jgi:MerR family transcriptional regulator, copper efflux regulator